MHISTLKWARLNEADRDAALFSHGITTAQLMRIRSRTPRERLLEAAKLAFRIDDEPNSDLIEFIAGYRARGGLYHHFRTVEDLRSLVRPAKTTPTLTRTKTRRDELDLKKMIPHYIESYEVHVENGDRADTILVWQKVNGGMRSMVLNRVIPRVLFLAGVLLYAGEGTKSLASSRVEMANCDVAIHRIFVNFLKKIGVPVENLKLRVQIHSVEEDTIAKSQWMRELGFSPEQFTKSLMKAPKGGKHRTTYTLHIIYQNTMLLRLLRAWTADLEMILTSVGRLAE